MNKIIFFVLALSLIACGGNQNTAQRFAQPAEGRAKAQLEAFVPARLNSFSENGEWLREEHLKPRRALEPLALVHVFLASGNEQAAKEANHWLENTNDVEWYKANYIILKYPELLTEKSKSNIMRILDSIAPSFLADHWDFVGVNDNFPSMAAAGCALYGQITGKRNYVDCATDRLERYLVQLRRSGLPSEYSSQAYCFLQIESMAMIAEMTNDEPLCQLALAVEEYYWRDVIGHYYPQAQKMAAAYCRAYAWDMRGRGLAYSLYEQVLGEQVPFVLLDDYFDDSEEWIKCRNATCYGVEYHCPQGLIDSVKLRKYPYSFIAMADGAPSSDNAEMELAGVTPKTRTADTDDGVAEYPAWKTRTETYMTPKYAISTSTRPFHSGSQTENFSIVYPQKGFSDDVRNTSTVFCRYVINGIETLTAPTDGYGTHGVVFNEQGRRMVLGYQNTAMVLYKPKAGFSKGVESLRVSVYIPNSRWMDGEPTIEQAWIGERRLAGIAGESSQSETVYIKDGDVYIAFIPLNATELPAEKRVAVEKRDGYTVISFVGYEGKKRDFSQRGFVCMGNGFVCEVGSADEYGSFDDFRKQVGKAHVTDFYRVNEHLRSNPVRYTKYSRDTLTIENEYSPWTEGIRFSTLNGKYIDEI